MFPQILIGIVIGAVLAVFAFMVILSFATQDASGIHPVVYSWFKDIAGPVSAGFGGAIAGALVSFKVQQDAVRRKELQLEARSFNRASSILAKKLSDLAAYKMAMVIPFEGNPLRFIMMPGIPGGSAKSERADTLLEEILISFDEFELLSEVSVVEERYETIVESIAERNRLVERHRDRMESSSTGAGRMISLEDVVKINGVGATIRLYTFSEQLVSALDDAIENIVKVLEGLNSSCAQRLKDRGVRIIKVEAGSSPALKRAAPPHFVSPDHLADVIEGQEQSKALAGRDWRSIVYR